MPAATALAVRLTGNRLGQVAAPAVAGLVAGGVGLASVFWLLGVMLAASAVAVQRPALQKSEQRLTRRARVSEAAALPEAE